MKKLILMRHSIAQYGGADFNRKLTSSGKTLVVQKTHNFEFYAKNNNLNIDYIFCSAAERTKETLNQFLITLNIPLPFNLTQNLYLPTFKKIKDTIISKDSVDNLNNLMIISHNMGISSTASILTGEDIILSESNIAVLSLELDLEMRWRDVLQFEGNWNLDSLI